MYARHCCSVDISLSKTDNISASWRFCLIGDETVHRINKKLFNHNMSSGDKACCKLSGVQSPGALSFQKNAQERAL